MTRLLFLDFDGVLHATSAKPDGWFARVGLLADALAGAECDLIISSSWRHHHHFDELVARFPPALRPRLAGTTGEPCFGRWPRYQEIVACARVRGAGDAWRALDDSRLEFPPGCAELIACDPNVGIDRPQVAQLRRWLSAR